MLGSVESPVSALPAERTEGSAADVLARLLAQIRQRIAALLEASYEELDPRANFMDLGFDSILAMQLPAIWKCGWA